MRGVLRILRRLIEIENAVERAAGANPVIHGFAHLLALIGVIIRSAIRSQGCADDLDAVLMRSIDDLL